MKVFLSRMNRDHWAGALMLLTGIFAAVQGAHYKIGSLSRMGPGFFPASVGALLALTGLAMLLTARRKEPALVAAHPQEGAGQPSQLRGWILICTSIVAFIVFGTYGGLVPATFAIVFISALADRENTLKSAFILALAMVVVCVVVFWWLLQVQFPLFRWG